MRSTLYLCHGLLILVYKQNDKRFYLQQDEDLFTYFTITEFSKFFEKEKVMPNRIFSYAERLEIIPVWIHSQALPLIHLINKIALAIDERHAS